MQRMSNLNNPLSVMDIITTSWNLTKGVKGIIWIGVIILIAIMIGFHIVEAMLDSFPILPFAINTIGQIISLLLQMGLFVIGINRATERPVHYQMLFFPFRLNLAYKLILLFLIQMIIFFVILSLFILLIPFLVGSVGLSLISILIGLALNLYFVIKMWLSLAYVLDQHENPLSAIKHSFQVTQGKFWRLTGLFFLSACILFVSIIPLGLGLIWTIPWLFVLYGVIYTRLDPNLTQSKMPL